jgi:hypothetical protein
MALNRLAPAELGGMFGRSGSLTHAALGPLRPSWRFCLLGLAVAFATLATAAASDVLVSADGVRPAVAQLMSPHHHIDRIGLSLLLDPSGLLIGTVALLTPLFCCQQIAAIRDFVPMNERNLRSLPFIPVDAARVNAAVATANRRFLFFGRRSVSAAMFAAAGLGSGTLYVLLVRNGLLTSWNFGALPREEWHERIYADWWANWHTHPVLGFVLWALGTYMFYFLLKQLTMGGIFAVFANNAAKVGFGVTPDLVYNSDGYRGLRTLRHFMLWTYGSSLAHFASVLALFVVWLPFSQITFFASVVVMIANALVVIYPSRIAYRSAIQTKAAYVRHLHGDTTLSAAKKEAAIEKVWSSPTLPFRTRSTLTAVTVYFLVPLLLAVISAFLRN